MAYSAQRPYLMANIARKRLGRETNPLNRLMVAPRTRFREDFVPRGGALEMMESENMQVLMSGAAGTGKSRAVLEKIHRCCETYAGMRALIVRKTRASTTESTLFTFEEKVLPRNHKAKQGPRRANRQKYVYPNGSEIVVSGMDYMTRIMSTEYDLIYVNECVEISEDDWEALMTRLRNGVMPYQQIIGDTNPAGPTHWVKRRADSGTVQYIESTHKDNPVYWDGNNWTEAGRNYIHGILSNLTGIRRLRYLEGKWAGADGLVHPEWNSYLNMCNKWPVPYNWPRFWGVDFGFVAPFVWSCFALSPAGILYRIKEIYVTGADLERDIIPRIIAETSDEPMPEAVICDHDVEGRATLERGLGIQTVKAYKGIQPGLQAVSRRLAPNADGKPGLIYFHNALDKVDPQLASRKLPTCTEEEFEGYVYKPGTEMPVDKDDHGMNVTKYVVSYVDKVEEGISGRVTQTPAWSRDGFLSDSNEISPFIPSRRSNSYI